MARASADLSGSGQKLVLTRKKKIEKVVTLHACRFTENLAKFMNGSLKLGRATPKFVTKFATRSQFSKSSTNFCLIIRNRIITPHQGEFVFDQAVELGMTCRQLVYDDS